MLGKRFVEFMEFLSLRNFYPDTFFCWLANQQYILQSQNFPQNARHMLFAKHFTHVSFNVYGIHYCLVHQTHII